MKRYELLLENAHAVIAEQRTRIAELETENGRLTGQCDARGNIIRYVAFVLARDEMADAQEAADKAAARIAELEAVCQPFAEVGKQLPLEPALGDLDHYHPTFCGGVFRAVAKAMEGR